jgi:hypothetical protein
MPEGRPNSFMLRPSLDTAIIKSSLDITPTMNLVLQTSTLVKAEPNARLHKNQTHRN